MLRKYEVLYILRHDSAPDVTQGAIDKVKGAITGQGGTILLHESWGKKKLAYEIKKASKGVYQLTTFAGEPTHITEIEHVLRINPEVMKWLTVQLNELILDLPAEIEHYSKIVPKMVPLDGEESAASLEAAAGAAERARTKPVDAEGADHDDDGPESDDESSEKETAGEDAGDDADVEAGEATDR